MRIANKLLGEPDYEYTSVLRGKVIMLRIFHEPDYCVQVITPDDSHAYPLTFEQYNNYCNHAEEVLHPSQVVIKKQLLKAEQNAAKFKEQKNLERFWNRVKEYYNDRLQHDYCA